MDKLIMMDESISYTWAARAILSVDRLLEHHKMEQLADAVSSAILEAYKLGKLRSIVECIEAIPPFKFCPWCGKEIKE